MFKATQNSLPADVAIFSAAVADFKVKEQRQQKIKKMPLFINQMIFENFINFMS